MVIDVRLLQTSHTSHLITGTLVDTLLGTWHCKVSAEIGLLGVSVLCAGEINNYDNNNNERISRAPFQVKHAQLH